MDIDNGGTDRLMSHKGFYSKQVSTILVKMGAKSMAERMAGQSFWPAEPPFMFMDVA